MKLYDYYEAIKNDIRAYIESNYSAAELKNELVDKAEFAEKLYDALWIEDSVTGNGSGAYAHFNTETEAQSAVGANLDLLFYAFRDFDNYDALANGASACDVTIRCYLLNECVEKVLGDLEQD